MLCCALLAEPVENNMSQEVNKFIQFCGWSQGFKNIYAKNQMRPDQVPVEVSQHDKLQVDEISKGEIILDKQVKLAASWHRPISKITVKVGS